MKNNKKIKSIKIALILFLLLFPQIVYPDYDLGSVYLNEIDGDVQIKSESLGQWFPASINTPLIEGDSLWIPDNAKLSLMLSSGSFVRAASNSTVQIIHKSSQASQFYIPEGQVYVNFKPAGTDMIQVDSPNTSLRCFERAVFTVTVTNKNETEIRVLLGQVLAETQSGKTTINSGSTLYMSSQSYASLYPNGNYTAWESWNRDRDLRVETSASGQSYMPEELNHYSYTLSNNGKWMIDNDYGYVWTPNAAYTVGWSPYSVGKWTWIGDDYIWISYEPWGWLPYHYGRWIFLNKSGWCWTPPKPGQVHWGPGFVGWIYTPKYVAWFPLGPKHVYYGFGYYGPNSLNIGKNTVSVYNADSIYKDIFSNKGVILVSAGDFISGNYRPLNSITNPFKAGDVYFGRPRATAS
ncbi:prolin-rich exported protein, partial [Candidatus Magnetoovum chiemensis]